MHNLLTVLHDCIFPPRETETIIKNLPLNTIDSLYSPGQKNSIIYLSAYSHKEIEASIVENKFHSNKRASLILGKILHNWTKHQIKKSLYIPIPLSAKKLRGRGYNQVEHILQETEGKISVNKNILKKSVDTAPQTTLKKEQRLNNLKGVFEVRLIPKEIENYEQIVIVDDVTTTGATLNEARATLLPHVPKHVELVCLAIAH